MKKKITWEQLLPLIKKNYFTTREKTVLTHRYRDNLTIAQTAKEIGVTRERIRTVEKNALYSLQSGMGWFLTLELDLALNKYGSAEIITVVRPSEGFAKVLYNHPELGDEGLTIREALDKCGIDPEADGVTWFICEGTLKGNIFLMGNHEKGAIEHHGETEGYA